jgi:hypothetical protein
MRYEQIRLRAGFVCALLLSAVGAGATPVVIESFDDGDISDYSVGQPGFGAFPSASGAAAHDGAFGLAATDGWWIYRDDPGVHVQQGDTVSAWIRFANSADSRAYFGFGASSTGTLSFVLAPNTGQIIFQQNAGYFFADIGSSPQAFEADRWYRAEVLWGSGGLLTGRLFDSDGTTLLNTVNASSSLSSEGGIAFRGFGGVKDFDTITRDSAGEPIPEPETVVLMAIGLAGLFASRKVLG